MNGKVRLELADEISIHLTVNGNAVSSSVPSNLSLMRFLRDELGLTGTKNGCNTGHCGACTVIVDGKATRACLVRTSKLNGARIQTIEGLAQNGNLHPIQLAFIEHGAVQCGFCTPGMIMATKALLDAKPHPTHAEIKKALTQNNNLCRCTGYVKILDAIQDAAERLASGTPYTSPPKEEGTQAVLSRDAVGLVTGTTRFGDDIHLKGMLHGKILWAAHPHAEILNVDIAEAEAMPGVCAVITARDIPGKNQAGIVIRDQPAIAYDKVRYIGDTLAAVFAETPELATEALKKIRVDYRVLPGVFSPEEAAQPDAPRVHSKGNLLHHAAIRRGDIAEAFSHCSVVVEETYTTPFIEHAFLEPESGIAFPTEDGVMLQMGTQCAFDDRTQLSEILALPEDKIRVVQLPMGGAFGGKEDMILQQYLSLGALRTGHPVKMVLTREESLRAHPKRHAARMHFKTGADREGRVLALQTNISLDTGAYASLGSDILENTLVFAAGPYYIPNLELEGWAWYTNNIPAGAMRGFGVNQVAVAMEQQMDSMARALGIDPFEFRLLNALDVGLPTAADHVLEEGVVSIKQTIRAAREAFYQMQTQAGTDGERIRTNGKKIGVGVACAVKNIGFGHGLREEAGAIVELDSAGCCRLLASQHDYGQGARAGLVQLVAHELNLPAERIEIIGPDTALTPPTGPTTASRQTFLTGNAVVKACRVLKEEIFHKAADILDVDPGQLELRQDRVVHPATGREVPLAELGERFVVEELYSAPHSAPLLEGETSNYGKPDFETRPTHWCYAYNTQVAVVEVDEASGEVKALTVVSANDVGKAINRQAIEGQIHGGVMMGLGFALSEQFVVEQGVNITDSLHKCRVPRAEQTPEIIPVIVEVPHPFGPQGAKGFAEAPSLATAPAILNAIYDAVGVRITSLPADKHMVKAALQASSSRSANIERR
jgi:CO/xanthine dehydrogenase Mo-binding subunit/aerobic-type carbon monoxide dehydrogenase small subunit (CoxS/CutS family)